MEVGFDICAFIALMGSSFLYFAFTSVLPPVLVPRHSEYPCMGSVAPGPSTDSTRTSVMPLQAAPLLMASSYGQLTSSEPSMPYNVTYPQGFTQTSPLPPATPASSGASPSTSLPPPSGIVSLFTFHGIFGKTFYSRAIYIHFLKTPQH